MSYLYINNINVEGVSLPNKPLSNYEPTDCVKMFKLPTFRGAFVRDELPIKPQTVECGSLSLNDSKWIGIHWVFYYKNEYYKLQFGKQYHLMGKCFAGICVCMYLKTT
jgi:hypothetical protein